MLLVFHLGVISLAPGLTDFRNHCRLHKIKTPQKLEGDVCTFISGEGISEKEIEGFSPVLQYLRDSDFQLVISTEGISSVKLSGN